MSGVAIFVGWLLLGLAGLLWTFWWSRKLWRRRRSLRRTTKILIIVLVGAATLGCLGTAVGLIHALGAVRGESIDPSQKARILGEGISQAMNFTALGLLVWLPSAILLFVMTRKDEDPPAEGG